ncbi:hypothetical protein AB5N96_07075 [Chryseomicrobium imtechense]
MKIIYFLIFILFLNIFLYPSGRNLVNIGFGSLDLLELSLWIIFVFTLYFSLLFRFKNFNKIKAVLHKRERIMLLLFIIIFLVSIILGFLNLNQNVLSQSRGIIVFLTTIVLFLLYSNKGITKMFSSRLLYFLLIFLNVSVILSYFSYSFTTTYNSFFGTLLNEDIDRFQRSQSGQFGTYSLGITSITLFSYLFGISNLLFGNFKMKYIILTLLGFISTNLFFQKPVVIGFLISNILLLLLIVYIKFNVKNIIRGLSVILTFALLIFFSLMIIPEKSLQNTINYINYGWLNIGREGFENDLSTGRFDLWTDYSIQALKGLGIAPWGFGKELEYSLTDNPHNIVVFLAYNIGIIGTIIFLSLIFSIIQRSVSNLKSFKYIFDDHFIVSFALVVFVLTTFLQALYGGTLDSIRTSIFMFSGALVILAKFSNSYDFNMYKSED